MIIIFFKSSFEKNKIIYDEYLKSRYITSSETFDTTYASYKSNMKQFFEWLKNSEYDYYILSKKFIKKIVIIMEDYIAYCKARNNNKHTINNKIVALSSFFIWASRRDLIEYNPMREKIEKMKNPRADMRRKNYFLTDEQIEDIYKKMEEQNFKVRDKLLFSIFLDTGARIGAIHNLKIEQIDFEDKTIYKVREKMGYIVDLFFFEKTEKYLKEYLSQRKDDNKYLFVAKYKGTINQMDRGTIRDVIRKIGTLIGIKDLYPHSLRKTSIDRVYKKSNNIELASEHANHHSTSMTKNHYIEAKKSSKKRQEIEKILGGQIYV